MASLILTGMASWLLRRDPGVSAGVGVAGSCIGCGLGLYGAGGGLTARSIESAGSVAEWGISFALFSRGLDAVSAAFAVCILIAGALVALAAFRRLPGDYAANRPGEHWFFLNLLLAAAVAVLLARNGVFFLFAWGTLLAATFFLAKSDRRTGFLTGLLGLSCLAAMFALMEKADAPLDAIVPGSSGADASAVLLLALAGFGTVMGVIPLHAGFVDRHPRAPFQAAAVMSGITGSLGIYGMIRVIQLLGGTSTPPLWWGWLLALCGLGSCALGHAQGRRERDLWRFLARTTQTTLGFAVAGLGCGLLGAAERNGPAAFLGFASALFLALGHIVVKPLLFVAAGTIQARTGTRAIATMGGLFRRMPTTGILFLLGILGMSVLPPLIGFWGMLFLFASALSTPGAALAVAAAALSVLCAIDGWRVFRTIFLGSPTGLAPVASGRERPAMLLPQLLLAVVAIVMAVRMPIIMRLLGPAVETLARVWWPPGRDAMRLGEWFVSGPGRHMDGIYRWAWIAAGCAGFLALTVWAREKRRK